MPPRPLRVVIAPDSFGGALDSVGVAAAIVSGWSRIRPEDELIHAPMADGGEGTLAALVDALGDRAERRTARAHDPLGREVDAEWLVLDEGRSAFVELASASGIARLLRSVTVRNSTALFLLTRTASLRPSTVSSLDISCFSRIGFQSLSGASRASIVALSLLRTAAGSRLLGSAATIGWTSATGRTIVMKRKRLLMSFSVVKLRHDKTHSIIVSSRRFAVSYATAPRWGSVVQAARLSEEQASLSRDIKFGRE